MPTATDGQARRELVLFHSVLGLRRGVLQWAERLRAAGHTVHTPDLYNGRVFDDFPVATQYFQSIGIEEMMSRSQRVAEILPEHLVYAGFSNGGASAEFLAAKRLGAVGAILMHAAMPLEVFGLTKWPPGVPVQVHYGNSDPYKDDTAVSRLRTQVEESGSAFRSYGYPVDGHLFADPELPTYDAPSADAMFQALLIFLQTLEP
jgi:dienelactone hydrolase